jgi:BMFP domain-containing protein YqiC
VDTKRIDEITRRISELVANTPVGDIGKNLRALLPGWLERMDLVTREELDAQREVLARTRDKLQQMEARVRALEAGSSKGKTKREG